MTQRRCIGTLTVAAIGLALGFYASRQADVMTEGRSRSTRDPSGMRVIHDTRRTSEPAKTPSRPSGHDLVTLRNQLDLIKKGGLANIRQVERMSRNEIQRYLEEMEKDPDGSHYDDSPEGMKRRDAMLAATSELVRREGVAALEWAAGKWPKDFQSPSPFFITTSGYMVLALNEQSPEEAKAWFIRLTDYDGGNLTLGLAGNQALAESVESLDNLKRIHGDKVLHQAFPWSRSRPDLDYPRLLREYPSVAQQSGIMVAASAKNPDEAWEATHAIVDFELQTKIIQDFISGLRRRMKGDEEAFSWLASKVHTLPVATRTAVIGDLVQQFEKDDVLSPLLMGALQNDDERIIAASLHISPGKITKESVKLLGLLESPDLQASAILMSIDDPQQRRLPSVFEEVDDSDFYRQLSEYMNLPEGHRSRIMAHLRERNVKTGNNPEK